MKRKIIWLVNRYGMPPMYESRLRTNKFAQYFQKEGYEVLIFGASAMHNMDINLINDRSPYLMKEYDGLKFIHIRTAVYGKKSRYKRFMVDYQFYITLCNYASDFPKPDVIINTGVPFIFNPLLSYAKRFKIPYILERLDVWPDNFIDLGIFSARNPIMKVLFAQAKYNSEQSDALVYSWSGCHKYISDKGWSLENGGKVDLNRVYYINNGVDVKEFNRLKDTYILDDEDLKSDRKKVVYIGAIRDANNVEALIKAASCLKERRDIIFLIYGDGGDRERLINFCERNKLNNVIFKEKWTDPKYVPYIVSSADVNVLNYYSSNFAKHGISSSKLFQYMAAGKPIVANINIFDCPITKNKIGVAKEFSSNEDYAEAIEEMIDLTPSQLESIKERANLAVLQYDYGYLANKMIKVIETVIKSGESY